MLPFAAAIRHMLCYAMLARLLLVTPTGAIASRLCCFIDVFMLRLLLLITRAGYAACY